MIFQKRRRYPYVLFIPQEYFSFKNIKLMRRNEIILLKLILLLWYFINQEVIHFFLVIPESFLTLILCPFWHEHTCGVSYQKDPALFDSFKIPHQVVAVVSDTVWALELASLSKNKFLFTALTGQHNKINLRPSRKGRQLSIVLRRQAEIIVCDMNVRRLCNSCCTQWIKNNPVVGLGMVLLFSRFFMEDPKYLCFNGAKNLSHSKHLLAS